MAAPPASAPNDHHRTLLSDRAVPAIYTISPDGRSITCHACGSTSYNRNDVAQRFCGRCKLFLDPVDEPYEFDCRDCGRHIISLCDPYRTDICAACRTIPGWFRNPELARRLDPGYESIDS